MTARAFTDRTGFRLQREGTTAAVALGLVACWGCALVLGAEGPAPVKNDGMRRNASRIRVESIARGQSDVSKPLPDALLNYSDPARQVAEGSLWAWGETGRPLAIVEVERYAHRPDDSRWLHGLVSLSPGLIACTWQDGRSWQSSAPGLVLGPVPDAPPPGASRRERTSQIRALTRKFVMREDAGPIKGKIQLRLLPSPIHRYSDPASGLQDGAIFAFAFGTNPEALLIIESRSSGSSSPTWQYGLARITGGALTAELAGRPVWSQSEANPPYQGETYMNRWHPVLPDAE